MNKRGGILSNVLVSLLGFGLVMSVFLVVPLTGDPRSLNTNSTFFNNYGVTIGDYRSYDQTSNVSKLTQQLKCDINPDEEGCTDTTFSLLDAATGIIQGIVGGGFKALLTIFEGVGYITSVVNAAAKELWIPEIVITSITSIITIIVLITIVLLIFNRGDLA